MFADERFAELLAEARKFGLALTIAHQFAGQLPSSILKAVLGNIGTVIALRIGLNDAEALEPLFWPSFSKRDLISNNNFRAFIRSFGCLGQQPFSIELNPPPTAGNPERAAAIRQYSRETYGSDREAVEKEIADIYRAYNTFASAKKS